MAGFWKGHEDLEENRKLSLLPELSMRSPLVESVSCQDTPQSILYIASGRLLGKADQDGHDAVR